MIEHDWEKIRSVVSKYSANNGFSVLSLKFGGNPQNCQSLDSKDYSFFFFFFFWMYGGGGHWPRSIFIKIHVVVPVLNMLLLNNLKI